ncbi:UDP-4-amino-4,6-dideoxy-N-acetyl-beta-L-altrosami ne transaminase [Alkalibacillus silvisoli]|uniref:UDP-4-amino-4, 6-dideoxy-N-acetyl-beta-L-altrosami ne transaminase n=2 Tax=Alkalibacillus silvisoli TaxID=392823 RepID=A0ABN0ZNS5_9BACI
MKPKLAIHGGTPVRREFLPYGRQAIHDDDIRAVTDVLKSDFLTTGPKIEQFEKAIASYVGAKYAVSFTNGTAALHAACFAAGINEGDEVITTPLTFVTSANAPRYQGANVVFSDVDEKTYNIDPKAAEKQITPKTKAIIPVDFAGQPCDYDALTGLAERYNLTIIEDAAHAIGAKYKNKHIGSISDMTMFSFHPVKQMTTGEGGIITTNSFKYYEKLIQFRTHGITREESKLMNQGGPWYYEMHHLGFNYRMTDLQAALGISQIKRLNQFIKKRKHLVSRYDEAFKSIQAITTPFVHEEAQSSWHLYVIHLAQSQLTTDRKMIYKALQSENIGVNVHYIPVYYHPYYKHLGYLKGLCPVAESLYESFITLPLFPSMTEADVDDVVKAVYKVIDYYQKDDAS